MTIHVFMKASPLIVAFASSFGGPAGAGSLQVAPVLLDLPAPATTATIKLRNIDIDPMTAQIRVFRWIQENGTERLEPTSAVVASPPLVELASRQDYTVRVIRVSGQPIRTEEAYRLVIDELPKPKRVSGTVAMLMRHVVPVFFTGKAVSQPAIAWSASRHGKSLTLSAVNNGDRRARLAAVTLRDASGTVLASGKGLLGYSLGRSSMQWALPAPGQIAAGTSLSLSGTTEDGPFNATVPMQRAR